MNEPKVIFKKARRDEIKAYVLNPHNFDIAGHRSPEERLSEAVGLAKAIYVDVVFSRSVQLPKLKPKYLFGQGIVDEIKEKLAELPVEVIFVNYHLSPVQQRNLEDVWKVKVMDRTGLILEIFGERAETREGRLQVEQAALTYQRSRIVRGWTHLERQRGGMSFIGGPGEKQIEMDRRIIDDKIQKIKAELKEVQRTRDIQRKNRARTPYPVVALIGYTNAGKSTLFNRVTGEAVFVKDLLFATLDPTMRAIKLPSGRKIIFSDTVGFISDLPTQLVAAFKSTLEEVLNADILLIVSDVSSSEYQAQFDDVMSVLSDLGVHQDDPRLLLVGNKIDLFREKLEEEQEAIQLTLARNKCLVSAVTGEGIEVLLSRIDDKLSAGLIGYEFDVPLTDGACLAWLHEHSQIVSRSDDDEYAHLYVMLSEKSVGVLKQKFGYDLLPSVEE